MQNNINAPSDAQIAELSRREALKSQIDAQIAQINTTNNDQLSKLQQQIDDLNLETAAKIGELQAQKTAIDAAPMPVAPKTEPNLTPGLSSSYYTGMALSGDPVLQRIEPTISFSVGNNIAVVPEAGPSKWSASYEGFIEAPITGQIKLWTASDDGVRLFIGDDKVIDNWTNHGTTWNSATLDVTRGQKIPVKLQYFQNIGSSTLQLCWEWSGQTRVTVPATALSHVVALPVAPAIKPDAPIVSPVIANAKTGFALPQNLGNPFLGKRAIYARNVWDMQFYNGKIYLGHGDSSGNSGNTPIWSLDPKSGTFTNEYTTTSEQVDEFFSLSDGLCTLNHDPTGGDIGFVYRKSVGDWSAEMRHDGATHQYSIIEFKGAVYVAGSTRNVGGWRVCRTLNKGATWDNVLDASVIYSFAPNTPIWGQRAYFLFELKGELYAANEWYMKSDLKFEPEFFKLNQKLGKFEKIGAQVTTDILSGGIHADSSVGRYKRKLMLGDGSMLTLLVLGVNDHQWTPLALLHVSEVSGKGINAVALPNGATPYDFIQRGNLIYVCAWDAGKQQVCVFSLPASNASATATEVLRFDAPTFARSFEESDGDFYFGLGCDESPTPAQTGEIWKVTNILS